MQFSNSIGRSSLIAAAPRQSPVAVAPSPLAGVASPWDAGTFLKETQTHARTLSDSELGEAIFRFVFQRY
jgi:hypothetical protein